MRDTWKNYWSENGNIFVHGTITISKKCKCMVQLTFYDVQFLLLSIMA